MREALLKLAPSDLRALAAAVKAGRLSAPWLPASVQRFVPGADAADVAAALQELAASGMASGAVARCLELLAGAMAERPPVEDSVDLVTTGPECGGVSNRDTSVVVRELFCRAKESVLVAGYAVYQGQKVFQALAERMANCPDLRVRLFLDIQRKPGETSACAEMVARFATRFRTTQWPPDKPLPEVFYDPRSLSPERDRMAALHAKCVVVDRKEVFVSSANFTEAAQEKNIEVGLLLRSGGIADRITRFFDSLINSGRLERAL